MEQSSMLHLTVEQIKSSSFHGWLVGHEIAAKQPLCNRWLTDFSPYLGFLFMWAEPETVIYVCVL